MGNESLRIVIGADLGPAAAELRRFNDTLRDTGEKAQSSFDRASAAFERMKAGFKSLGNTGGQANSLLRPIEELEAELRKLEAEFNRTTNVPKLTHLADQIKRLNTQINNIKVVGFES